MRSQSGYAVEYIRSMVASALAESVRGVKGQLEDIMAPARSTRYRRSNSVIVESDEGYCYRNMEPMHCIESRHYISSAPPLSSKTYRLTSWRRAAMAIDKHHSAWIYYCYAGVLDYEYQVTLCHYLWQQLQIQIATKRIREKVMKRVRSLVWLAIQETAMKCRQGQGSYYSASYLAKLIGVKSNNWSMHYLPYWNSLIDICQQLDNLSLVKVAEKRAEQRLQHRIQIN